MYLLEKEDIIMLSEERKKELDILMERASCAGDDYYLDMEQDEFDDEMEGCEEEEFYKGFCRQREIGFEAYKKEIAELFSHITSAEELHYMIADYNYDDGMFTVEQIVMNPACDIVTAKMVYWLCGPTYYYDKYGSPSKCSEEDINRDAALLLTKMEAKAAANAFKTGLEWNGELVDEQPANLDFTREPYCHVPAAFR